MSYDPDQTNVLPSIERPFPITEELPVVGPIGRGPSGRFFLGLLAALLIAAIVAIAAILIIDDQRSNQAIGDDNATPTADTDTDNDDTPAPTPVDLDDAEPGFWQVVGVADGLNVRSGPGTDNNIVGALRLGDRHIFATGERATVNGSEWKQIRFGDDDTTGWVSASFLSPDSPPDETAPTPTPAPTGSTSVVCFGTVETPRLVARITFTDRTAISGIIRTITSQSSSDQTVAGTLSNGSAEVTLTPTDSTQPTRQTWTFNPASVDLGNGRSLQVVNCASVASELP